MDATDLCYAGAAMQAGLIRSGEVSASEMVEATLARIEAVNPKINAFRCVFAEEAIAEARAIDGGPRGSTDRPLLGVPVGVKDTVDVAGAVTTHGSAGFEVAAARDDPMVAGLREAGAVIIAKSTSSELAVWPFTENETWGATRNPWNTDFSPGGSSGGSGAAVAAGLCGLATGSDGLGSIRVPSGFNGVFGLKPGRGRVFHGPLDWNGLSARGPISRSVADAALFLDATAIEPRDAAGGRVDSFANALAEPPGNLRIALAWKPMVDWPFSSRLGDDERAAVDRTVQALRDLGHTVVERELNFSPTASSNGMIRYLAGIDRSLAEVELPDRITQRTRAMARLGSRIPDRVVRRAVRDSAAIAQRLNAVFDDVDVVLTPGAVERPLRIGELDGKGAFATLRASGRRIPHYGIWNVVGQPAASVPAGFAASGLPVSVHLAAKPFDEVTLLRLAAQLETAQPWAQQRPL